jgi:hypothetical protein
MICPVCSMEMEDEDGMFICRSPGHARFDAEGGIGDVIIYGDDPDRYWDPAGSHLIPAF